jgi:uncharacterized 2Fe-2S/4Fe-4S cluster protein (DUF4445 family)
VQVRFQPDDVTVPAREGETLLQAGWQAGIYLRQTCGGQGTCAKCRVELLSGELTALQEGAIWEEASGRWALACQTVPASEVEVRVPPRTRLSEDEGAGVLTETDEEEIAAPAPLYLRREVALKAPTLEDATDDLLRLGMALRAEGELTGARLEAVRRLPTVLREHDFQITVDLARRGGGWELAEVSPPGVTEPPFGVAVDIGTTTVAVSLVDLSSGYSLAAAGDYNAQVRLGEDVISRIVFTEESPHGLHDMRRAVLNTVNGLLEKLSARTSIDRNSIRAAAVAGNTTMISLLLGVSPRFLRREPYVPPLTRVPVLAAREVGLRIHPEAQVYCLPSVASYLGADLVSGVLATGLGHSEGVSLLLDVGTNGEMVLGGADWLLGCACSAGPAFEGSGIRSGTRAVPGAIEKVEVAPGGRSVEIGTMGGARPVGICGSGLIEALGSLAEAGVLDRAGKFLPDPDNPRLRRGEDGWEYLLAGAADTAVEEDIVLAQTDLDNLIRAKGAIFAGLRTLLQVADLRPSDIQRVYIAGGFGRFLDLERSIRIGLLPDLPREVFRYVGNSSLRGAKEVLLDRRRWEEAHETADRLTYVELSAGTSFMDEFVSALFLPHTDLELFPSVRLAG